MQVLTSSSLSAFRDCPRKYQYMYGQGRVRVTVAAALAFGKLMHGALEVWWTADMEAVVKWLSDRAGEIEPEDAARIAAMLAHYNPPRDQYEVLAVEEPFEMKIEHPDGGRKAFRNYRLAGKVDLLLKHKATGEVWICDHKTTSSDIEGFGTYWQALHIDSQMGNYCLAYNAVGFIYDALRKPGVRMCGKDEVNATKLGVSKQVAYQQRIETDIVSKPPHYYQWREFRKTDSETEAYRGDLWQQVEMFRACDNDARFPRNSNACVSRYGTCPYIDVCTGRASIEDDSVFRSKVQKHEELSI